MVKAEGKIIFWNIDRPSVLNHEGIVDAEKISVVLDFTSCFTAAQDEGYRIPLQESECGFGTLEGICFSI